MSERREPYTINEYTALVPLREIKITLNGEYFELLIPERDCERFLTTIAAITPKDDTSVS